MTQPPKKQYHRLSIVEQRAELRRRHDVQFARKMYRCRRCRTILDEQSCVSHLDRCEPLKLDTGMVAKLIADFFEERDTEVKPAPVKSMRTWAMRPDGQRDDDSDG